MAGKSYFFLDHFRVVVYTLGLGGGHRIVVRRIAMVFCRVCESLL